MKKNQKEGFLKKLLRGFLTILFVLAVSALFLRIMDGIGNAGQYDAGQTGQDAGEIEVYSQDSVS